MLTVSAHRASPGTPERSPRPRADRALEPLVRKISLRGNLCPAPRGAAPLSGPSPVV